MKLSKSQEKLLKRIEEISNNLANKAIERDEPFDGWVKSALLTSEEFGFKKPNIRTCRILEKMGLVELQVIIERHNLTDRLHYNERTYVEKSYKFKLK